MPVWAAAAEGVSPGLRRGEAFGVSHAPVCDAALVVCIKQPPLLRSAPFALWLRRVRRRCCAPLPFTYSEQYSRKGYTKTAR